MAEMNTNTAELLQQMIDIKRDMRAAIGNKGVTVVSGMESYPEAINQIQTSEVVIEGGLDFSPLNYNSGLINKTMTALQGAIEYGDYISKNLYRDELSVEHSPSMGTTYMLQYNTQNNKKLLFFPDVQLSNINYTDGWEMMLFLDSALISIGNIIMDTERTANVSYMFCGCANLQCIGGIDLRNTKRLYRVFMRCSNLINLPAFDCSGLEQMTDTFVDCSSLENIGGFINLGKSITTGLSVTGFSIGSGTFAGCKSISRESMLNIFNGLYDISNVEYSTNDVSTTLYFESSVLSRLSDEDIAIATNKGWSVATLSN